MNGLRFDSWTRALASGTDRRGLLRGLAAAAAAALGLRAAGARAQQAKLPLCHATGDPASPYVLIEVAEPAWDTHLAHGDHPFVDCCADADCPAGQACVGGACGCPPGTAECHGACCPECCYHPTLPVCGSSCGDQCCAPGSEITCCNGTCCPTGAGLVCCGGTSCTLEENCRA